MKTGSTPRLRPTTLWKVAAGALVLQASYHVERRQGLGIAAALAPLGDLWETPDERRRFLTRHLAPLNTNPALAGVLLGALAGLEERAAAGDARAASRVDSLRRNLEGPFAAVGDALLWAGLRPLAGLAGGLTAWFAGAAGVAVFLVVYNLAHLGFRVGGVFWGYRHAEAPHRLLLSPRLAGALRILPWTLLAGSLALVLVVGTGSGNAGWTAGPAAALGAEVGRRGVSRGGLLAGGAIVCGLLLSLIMNR